MKKLPIVLLFMVLLYTGTAFAHYPDIEGNWARDAIINLAEQNIFAGIFEGYFEPNRIVSREEIDYNRKANTLQLARSFNADG